MSLSSFPTSRLIAAAFVLLLALPSAPSRAAAPAAEVVALRPRLEGPWIKIAGRPQLERWATPKAEPVDFTVFRADNGRWQLIACVRHTSHPGNGRLLHRWSSDRLDAPDWRDEGIFLESDPTLNHREGHLQAPFHVHDGSRHHLFYNSQGAHLLTSPDGLAWTPHGDRAVFPMGRDVCILDDRAQSGRWIAYYTSPEPGINPATRDHTIRARTAASLTGPWSGDAVEIPPRTPPARGYTFVYAESPTVVYRQGHYYRFEQMIVFRSRDPLSWNGDPVANLLPQNPIRLLAPEIVTHEGRDYLLAYQWLNDDERGIFLAPLAWDAAD